MGTLRRVGRREPVEEAPASVRARVEQVAEAEAERRSATLEEVSLTPAMVAALTREAKRRWRIVPQMVGLMMVFAILGGLIGHATGPELVQVSSLLVGLALLIAVGIVLYQGWRIRSDIAIGWFLRATGVSYVEHRYRGGEFLIVGDQTYSLSNEDASKSLKARTWRSIDVSRHADVIFEARDAAGQVVYRSPGYTPDVVA